jgi:hypothetical protein
VQDGAHHILVVDEDKRAVRAGDGEDLRLLEQVGDLVAHRRAEDRSDAEDDLFQFRDGFCAVVGQHFLDQPLVAGIGEHSSLPRTGSDSVSHSGLSAW